MKKLLNLRIGQTVPVLFIGVAALEFARTKNWVPILYFGALALAFMLLANKKNSGA